MSKTLVVTYLPRGEISNTKKVLDSFLSEAEGKTDLEIVDLIKDTPEMFLDKNLLAYIQRHYMGEELSSEQKELMASFDRFTKQVTEAENIVIAYPMYNFSFPAIIKAWFDAVMLKGETWDIDESGYIGLMNGKKALIVSSSGGSYKKMVDWDHSSSLGKLELQFMGFSEIEFVSAAGVNESPEKAEEIITEAQGKVREVAVKWFG